MMTRPRHLDNDGVLRGGSPILGRDGPSPALPIEGRVPRSGAFDDLPTRALFTSPFKGEAGRGPSRSEWISL